MARRAMVSGVFVEFGRHTARRRKTSFIF